jgi:hypothetical protein
MERTEREEKDVSKYIILFSIYFCSLISVFLFIIQGVIESCTDILTTSYWRHVELEKNI